MGLPSGSAGKNPPAMQETWVGSLGQEDPPGGGHGNYSIIPSWRIPWREEPGSLWSMLLLLLLSRFSCVRLCATPQLAAHQAPPSWDSSGKNTGEGCHFLLQCMKVKSESKVAQSCPTLSDSMDSSLPGSFIHGIFQARVLE